MKKIFILFSFIVLSITPTFAESMAVQAVTEISTTKPNEIIKVSEIKKVRVIRIGVTSLLNNIFDLNKFIKTLPDKDEIQFYSLLFRINYSDLIFANKII